MTSVAELRAEWVRQQCEPVDQFWLGPAPFVERLLGIIEDQQRALANLHVILTRDPLYVCKNCGEKSATVAKPCHVCGGSWRVSTASPS